jgi:tRNA(fMet)-specific endonuclease VapC
MPEFMLDSDICIYLMSRCYPALVERFAAATGRICVSAIVMAELIFGAEKSDRPQQSLATTINFLEGLLVVPFTPEAARHHGEIRAYLERAGTPCGGIDMLIGAHARSLDLTLVTKNRREFDRMPGVRVENWV